MTTRTSSAAASGLPHDRRSFLSIFTSAPAMIAAAGLPGPTFNDRDDDLLALREPYEQTRAAAMALAPEHTRAEEAVIAIMHSDPSRNRSDVELEVGFDVAERQWEAAVDFACDVVSQIAEMTAHTLEGLIFKARICERESMDADLAESIVADLVALGGRRG